MKHQCSCENAIFLQQLYYQENFPCQHTINHFLISNIQFETNKVHFQFNQDIQAIILEDVHTIWLFSKKSRSPEKYSGNVDSSLLLFAKLNINICNQFILFFKRIYQKFALEYNHFNVRLNDIPIMVALLLISHDLSLSQYSRDKEEKAEKYIYNFLS